MVKIGGQIKEKKAKKNNKKPKNQIETSSSDSDIDLGKVTDRSNC